LCCGEGRGFLGIKFQINQNIFQSLKDTFLANNYWDLPGMKTTVRLNVKTAYIIIFVYIVLEILLNILLRIFLESGASEETSRLIDSVIGIGMVTNIIISILLIFTTIYIFKADTKDI
jgi:hypothetical protein